MEIQIEFNQIGRPVFVHSPEITLRIINLQRQVARGFVGNFRDGDFILNRLLGELQHTPHFGPVHIHDALRRPDPIIFRRIGNFLICVVGVGDLPFDAREVDAPLLAFARRTGVTHVFSERLPRKRDFHRPAVVKVGGIVQRAVNLHGSFRAGNFPFVMRLAAVHVRFVQQQIPRGVERVHLGLVIRLRLTLGVNEHLEVRIAENHRVVIRERGPDVRFFKLGSDVEIIIIPQHLGAGAKTRHRLGITLDVHEIIRPRRGGPSGFIKFTVNDKRRGDVVAKIILRGDGLHLVTPSGMFGSG